MNSKLLKLLKRSERKLIDQLSFMSRKLQPPSKTKEFLRDLLEGLRDKSIKMEDFCFPTRVFVLQPITRADNKRRSAAKMLINLLNHVGKEEAEIFQLYLDRIEEDLNKSGRSYFKKT